MVLQHGNVIRVVILGKKGVGKSGNIMNIFFIQPFFPLQLVFDSGCACSSAAILTIVLYRLHLQRSKSSREHFKSVMILHQ